MMTRLATFVFAVISTFFIFIGFTASASHIVGSDLTYAWVSGNTYKVTLWLYADCGPASAAAYATLPTSAPKICIFNGTTFVDTFSLAVESPSSGVEVTPTLCPGTVSQCASPSSSTPGITLFRYSANYTLPSASSSWRFHFNGNLGAAGAAGRAAAITNISTPGSTWIELEATLNNLASSNNNPVLHVIPLPYYAINMHQGYNPLAIDADGDSLVYSLVSASSLAMAAYDCSAGGPVSYTSGTSAAAPLQTSAGGFAFNSSTGQMLFYPNTLQRGIVVYTVKEYRSGVLVGSLQREITVLVTPSANALPRGNFSSAISCSLVDTTTILTCDTAGSFSATIPATDANVTDTINVLAMGLPVGATLTVAGNGTSSPISTFSWNTTSAAPGTYTFFIKYTDGACPMSGVQTIAYSVIVAPCVTVGLDQKNDLVHSGCLDIYPNPATDDVRIALPATVRNATLSLTDVYGRILKCEKISGGKSSFQINTATLAAGTYQVRLEGDQGVLSGRLSVIR